MTRPFGPNKKTLSTTYIGLAIKILSRKNRPMHVIDLFEEISKYKKSTGKTPEKTLSSVLQKSPLFRKTSDGYVLEKKHAFLK
ncbi:MAG: winged helix-turn-helix domain-containing protein [Candidatus Nitrosopumilus sp. bin_32a]